MGTATGLILVRHGESVGNVAATAAYRSGGHTVPVGTRDADTPLSQLGHGQAAALGAWLGGLGTPPEAVWCSPYVRARQTADDALARAGLALPVRTDERLRDRELGVLDRLTAAGVAARFPDEAERRRHLGKLYHRPPGGESWADVALRLRSVLRDLLEAEAGRLVLVISHDAVVALVRYVLERLDEDALMGLVAQGGVRNASVTRLEPDGDGWHCTLFDDVGHLAEAGVPATEHEGEPDVGPASPDVSGAAP